MINVTTEINRLRWKLQSQDIPYQRIDQICDSAAAEIDEIIAETVDNAVARAIEYAADIGAEQFVEELQIIEVGGSYQVHTISGRTDFSVPEIPNKENLLRNAKVGKDGIRSRVIPIGGKSGKKPTMPTSSFSADRQRQQVIDTARDAVQSNSGNWTSSVNSMTDSFKERLNRNIEQRKAFYSSRRSEIKDSIIKDRSQVEFRTVSDRSPDDSWVIPARELDMTGFLMGLNRDIESTIDTAVISIVDEYSRDFQGL